MQGRSVWGGQKQERWGGVSGSWGRGEHVEQCQNHTHICCSSRMFPISLKRFLQPCERVPGCQNGVWFSFLYVHRWSVTFSSSQGASINYPNFGAIQRSTKAGAHISAGTARKANKWLLMCSVTQTEKQMPSTHKSTQLLQASVDNYLYRN